MKVTLADVAKEAGVSVATVSKVINRRPGVGAAVRATVRKAITQVGYEPRAERTGPKRIMVIFDALVSPYSSLLLSGAISTAAPLGYDIVVATEEGICDSFEHKRFEEWLSHEDHDVEGIVIVTAAVSPDLAASITTAGLPIVLVDPMNFVAGNIVKIGATNWAGGHDAVKHLIDLGHTRIAHIAGPVLSIAASERHEGYRSALLSHGIAYDPELVKTAPFSFEGGFEAGMALLQSHPEVSAVFASSDATAMGLLEAARRLEIPIPQKLSVVGFDDTYLSEQSAPPLTTIHQPVREMGGAAIRTIQQLLDDPDAVNRRVQYETSLVVRGSTARYESS